MGFSTSEIEGVRAMPVVLAADAGGRWQTDPGFVEVVIASSAEGKFHQVYVDGRLAGVTTTTDERAVIVPASEVAASLIEVVAVDPEDRLRDFGESLAGYGEADGARVRVAWYGGRYLGDGLDHFDVYGGPAGAIDYASPLNPEPIAPLVDGENLGGWGCGGFGRGGWGRSAMSFELVTAKHWSGAYEFEVRAVDASGNWTGGPAARTSVEVRSLPRPPRGVSVTDYDEPTRAATIGWTASEDIG